MRLKFKSFGDFKWWVEMDELPQDLGLALEDSSLKHDSDEQGVSESDMKIDEGRRRKMRKRRTTNASSTCQVNISITSSQLNNSPKSSSSLDEAARTSRYLESFTANCSDETDEKPRMRPVNGTMARNLPDRSHHKRVYKQARPCYCESDSHTENAPVYPRKPRKKKPRRMMVDNTGTQHAATESSSFTNFERKNVNDRRNVHSKSSEGTIKPENMCIWSGNVKQCQMVTSCSLCTSKQCGKLLDESRISYDDLNREYNHIQGKILSKEDISASCPCYCHNKLHKEECSHSGSSCNSDTDSANFSPDDLGGDGDDEMTDFYAESDGGSVLGIPRMSYLLRPKVQSRLESKRDESIWSYEMNNIRNVSYHGNDFTRSMTGANADYCRFHGRPNRYSKKLSRYCRRPKRRSKVKKTKDKNLKEYDLNQMTKLSLGNRNKRIRLEGTKDSTAQQEWPSQKLNYTPSINFATMDIHEDRRNEDKKMTIDDVKRLELQN